MSIDDEDDGFAGVPLDFLKWVNEAVPGDVDAADFLIMLQEGNLRAVLRAAPLSGFVSIMRVVLQVAEERSGEIRAGE